MNEIAPPMPPPVSTEKTARSAIWSVCLVSFVWVGFFALMVVVGVMKPADNDKHAWFMVGVGFINLFAALIASILLASAVLIKRRKGAVLAIVTLALAVLPLIVFALAAISTTLGRLNK